MVFIYGHFMFDIEHINFIPDLVNSQISRRIGSVAFILLPFLLVIIKSVTMDKFDKASKFQKPAPVSVWKVLRGKNKNCLIICSTVFFMETDNYDK